MNQDLEHLRLLSIFHYIVAALAALFACFPVIHLAIGIMMVFFPDTMGAADELPPALFGWIFIVIGGGLILTGLTLAVFIAITGRFLGRCHRHLFCTVVAAIECLFIPFGTVLGVFTLVVLMRPSVRELFGETPPAAPEPPSTE